MTPPVRAAAARISVAAEQDFLRRHRGHLKRAHEVLHSLAGKRDALLADVALGPIFRPPRLPAPLRMFSHLRVIKGLPHGFRALYTVLHEPGLGVVVQVEWLGDHDEYDKTFGYATS